MSLGKISFILLVLAGICIGKTTVQSKVNLGHLLSLIHDVELNGQRVSVVDIYADYPTYKPVIAKGEGFACVDDAARAAVLLIRYNRVFHSNANRETIDGLVNFVLAMQTRNGCFYNFLVDDGGKTRINMDGRTSVASFGWWAERALWALGEAAEYYHDYDTPRFNEVVRAINISMPQVDSILQKYGKLSAAGEPTWLLYGDGADASSELVLGLNAAYRATGKKEYLEAARKFCKGILLLQHGDCGTKPYGMFASNGGGWHAWANSQAAALMGYSLITGDKTILSRALEEVNCFLPRWAGAGFFRSCNSYGDSTDYTGQIAYGIQPALSAAVAAYEMTHDNKYRVLAYILASWFFGNNTARTTFYYSNTGLCFDGTVDSVSVNKNSGAESTVEALLSMVDLARMGRDTYNIHPVSHRSFNAAEYRYNFDGKMVIVRMTSDGFQVVGSPKSN